MYDNNENNAYNPAQTNVPPQPQAPTYYSAPQNSVEPSVMTERRPAEYYAEESYYQTNPLPRRMPSSPYEPMPQPQYANPPFEAQPINEAPKKSRGTVMAVISVMLALTIGLGSAYYIALVNDNFDDPETYVADTDDDDEDDDNNDGDKPEITAPDENAELPAETNAGTATNPDHKLTLSDKPLGGEMKPQEVYEEILPSVVSITAKYSANSESRGTGFIVTQDGYVVTNHHVVDNCISVSLTAFDGTEYDAVIVGSDEKTDISVLKINSNKKFEPCKIGNSDNLVVGDSVFAIGNMGGQFSNTFTGGYISGLNRTLRLTDDSIEMNYIQTDATINSGNSGGPLLNAYGQVVGINNFKFVGVYSEYENMNFAIAINEALPVINSIINNGYVTGRVRVGITYTAINKESAEQYNSVKGLYIRDIAQDCDISNCDIQPGDIITKINGKEVYSSETVDDALEGYSVGEYVTAEVYREDANGNGSTHTIKFRLSEFKE